MGTGGHGRVWVVRSRSDKDVRPRFGDLNVSNDLTVRPTLLGEWILKLSRSGKPGEMFSPHCQCNLHSNHSGD